MSKNKMTKDTIPEDFTLTLALVDAVPVLFFSATMLLVGLLFRSPLFLIGAGLVLFAGAAKVLWKVIVVLKKKNIWWMFLQMRILMPIGMVLMLLSLVLGWKHLNGAQILAGVTSFPTVACFGVGILGMVLMMVFAFVLDSSDVKSNWIEQSTNGVAQIAFFVGMLLIVLGI